MFYFYSRYESVLSAPEGSGIEISTIEIRPLEAEADALLPPITNRTNGSASSPGVAPESAHKVFLKTNLEVNTTKKIELMLRIRKHHF